MIILPHDGNYLSSSDIIIDLQTPTVYKRFIINCLGSCKLYRFKEIYLLGADYLTDPPVYSHFYDGFYEIGRPSDYRI